MDLGIGQGLLTGFAVASTPVNLLFCFLGVTLGTLIGVLPGIGPAGAIAMLLPFTFGMDVTTAIIMLCGIYYGAMYGGSTTSILINIPGEVASVVTTFDGYQMARKGRAGAALAIAAIGSFIGGTFSVIALTFVATPIAMAALRFGPPEYFALALVGVVAASYLSGKSLLKGLIMVIVGLMLSTIGVDIVTGGTRFTFGQIELYSGIEIVPILMGIFGVTEIMFLVEEPVIKQEIRTHFRLRELWPSSQELRASSGPILRGSLLGFVIGLLPGAGAMVSSFLSYATEKKLSKHPEAFGTGVIEGVAGPETANNAAAGGAMIPLLVLGVPYSVITAIMLSALITHGLSPSPMLMIKQPEFFWGVVASMYIGNVICVFLNLPLVGVWASLLRVPFNKLFPLILLCCVVGVFTVNSKIFDLWVMVASGVIGYLLRKAEYPAAPLVLALVLGPLMENALRQSILISHGDPLIFLTRPISGVLMFVSILFVSLPIISWLSKRKGGVQLFELPRE
jgi:putative tricarboxylic transport membrane protein